jgi:uncharacterized linocin/CFP29 family protein
MAMDNLNRDKLTDWTADNWKLIDRTVHDMAEESRVARSFLPIVPMPDAKTVPADIIDPLSDSSSQYSLNFLSINQGNTIPVFMISVGFSLTQQQILEKDLSTARTLAARAANLLSQAEDLLIFQGENALKTSLFTSGIVKLTGISPKPGLVEASANQKVSVELLPNSQDKYGENTFGAVAKAYSILQGNGYYRDDALILPTAVYADTWNPLPSTLQTPADRIANGLAKKAFFSTGTLPSAPPIGILVSPGEDTMDLVVAMDAATAYLGQDPNKPESYNFQVTERLALRVKVKEQPAVVRLEFQQGNSNLKSKT